MYTELCDKICDNFLCIRVLSYRVCVRQVGVFSVADPNYLSADLNPDVLKAADADPLCKNNNCS